MNYFIYSALLFGVIGIITLTLKELDDFIECIPETTSNRKDKNIADLEEL